MRVMPCHLPISFITGMFVVSKCSSCVTWNCGHVSPVSGLHVLLRVRGRFQDSNSGSIAPYMFQRISALNRWAQIVHRATESMEEAGVRLVFVRLVFVLPLEEWNFRFSSTFFGLAILMMSIDATVWLVALQAALKVLSAKIPLSQW